MNTCQHFLQSKEHGERYLGGQGRNSNESQIVSDAIGLLNGEEYYDDEVSEVDSDEGERVELIDLLPPRTFERELMFQG